MKATLEKETKIQFMIENWNKMTIKEMSIKFKCNPYTIAQWATRCRKIGIDLPRKTGERINWEGLRLKYAKKT